jgi:hypothetical protein
LNARDEEVVTIFLRIASGEYSREDVENFFRDRVASGP